MNKQFLMLTKAITRITEIEGVLKEMEDLIGTWGRRIEALEDKLNKIKKD